jgi:predicted secreted protein
MDLKYLFLMLFIGTLIFVTPACMNGETVTPTSPKPTASTTPRSISLAGPACPDAFQEQERQQIQREITLNTHDTLTLTLGSTPSIPCSWESPEISNDAIVHQLDHRSTWPAEGATPQPGAPGVEIWVFEALQAGESTISLACMCLGEQGAEEELTGTFSLNVDVR